MSSDPDLDTSISVTEGPVTVTKSYEADEFPVPAIKFVLESTATEPVTVRLTDAIPESFPMENVGFHPDFEKDNWTAYKSHRVEYDRTLDPEESTTTVYGVRLEGMDPATFLIEPTLSVPDADDASAAASAVDDVLGEDSNQIVRDVLSGERESLPGLDDENGDVDEPDLTADAAVDAESETESSEEDGDEPPVEDLELDLDEDEEEDDVDAAAPSPHPFDSSADSAIDRPDEAVVSPVETDDEDVTAGGVELELDEEDESEADPKAETEPETAEAAPSDEAGADSHVPDGVVAALADEVRRGDVDEADVAALRDALGVDDESAEIPRSLDLRISRLQTQVEDLAAYSDGLREFLDEEGTADELIDGFRADVRATEEALDALSARVDDADHDRGRLHEDVNDLRADVSGVDDRLDTVEDGLTGVTERLDGVGERLSDMDDRLSAVDDRLEQFDERLATVDDRLEGLDEHRSAVDERLDSVDAHATSAEETADRLDDEMGEIREELATLDSDITAARTELGEEITRASEQVEDDVAEVRESLGEDVSAVRDEVHTLEDDLERLNETVEDFREFRDRLSSALGTMAGGGAVGQTADGDGDDGDTGDDGDADEHEAADDEDDDT